MKDASQIEGKEFFSPLTGEGYAIHEAFRGDLPEGFSIDRFGEPFANDPCGNLFTEKSNGQICYWDHETDEVAVIAERWLDFNTACREPAPVQLKEGQVKSVWIDPDFARELGIEVPDDGWKKPPT